MILVYSVFMLFFSWITAIQYIKKNKKKELVYEFTVDNKKKLTIWCIVVFFVMFFISGIQCYNYLTSIVGSDLSAIVNGLENYVDFAEYKDETISILNGGFTALKIYFIPAKILKYVLQVVFGTLSVIVFYVKSCLKRAIKIPNGLRNTLFLLCGLDVVYILVAIF